MDTSNFVDDMMNSLPRLAPVWHDFSHQQMVRNKSYARFAKDKLPDFGGAGVDVILDEDGFKCRETKIITDNCSYSAVTCSLPFLPANKVADMSDPCLAPLNEEKAKFKRFCSSLESLRISFRTKNKERFQKEILSAHAIINKMSRKKKFKKTVVPESVLQLAMDFPEKTVLPPINMSYAGGCLSTSRSADGNYVILRPTGEKLNRLGFTALEEAKETDKHFRPLSMEENSIKLKNGRILQITSCIDGYCYVRQRKSCHFVNFSDLSNISQSRLIKKEEIMSIVSSPYIPLDYIVIYDKGNLEVKSLEMSEPIWVLDKEEYAFPYTEIETTQCSFGSHPQSVLCLNEKFLYSFDMRLKNKKTTLFSNDYTSCSVDEKLVGFKSCAVNYFQHVITSNYHMFVCDERYPKRPVLIYNHMLSGYPLYCDKTILSTTHDSSDVMVIISTQDSNELCAFPIKAQLSLVQPVSLSPPLHLSSPTDCAESLKLHCIPVEDSLIQRLSYPVVGIGVLSHTKDSGYTAFQLNSLGDLFYQDFEKNDVQGIEKTRKVDVGCVLTPPDRIQPHLSQFWPSVEETEDPPEFSHSKSIELNVDLTKVFNALRNIPTYCGTCNPDKEATLTNPVEDQNISCSSCGFKDVQSRNLNEAFYNSSLLSGSVNQQSAGESFDLTSFYECNHPLSKKMLDTWDFPDSDDKPDSIAGTPTYDSDFSFATSTPASACPSPYSSTSSLNESSGASLPESKDDIVKRLFQDISTVNTPLADLAVDSMELMEEFVPPSQEVRPLVGETLRILKKSKSSHKKNSATASAGF